MIPYRALAMVLPLMAAPALGQDTGTEVPATPMAIDAMVSARAGLTLSLDSTGDIERRIVGYNCEGDQTLSVQYINAAPNFLAIVPVEGQNLVFASALSASGARYVSGPYEWWSHQGEATLRDLMQDEDTAPLASCTETSNTP